MTPAEYVAAARVPPNLYPEIDVGPWHVRRLTVRDLNWDALDVAPPGLQAGETYTCLGRWTMATLHRWVGDVVMEDTPREISRHLPIFLHGKGTILVTGLGLGCVVRGLCAKPDVKRIDVVEIDEHIIRLVGPEFDGDERVRIHQGDAETIPWSPDSRWDYAWHDLWTEDEHLDLLHARVLARYRNMATVQGVWGMERRVRHRWPDPLLGSSKRANRRRA